MKIRPHHAIVLTVFLLTACSPVVYEAPQASHGRYYSYQTPVIIHHDHRYTPQHRQRIEQELRHRHTRAAAIYQGRGRHGDLIEVSIRGGHLYHQGRNIKYDPVSFRIARGDIIRVPASGLEIDLFVRYDHGRLAMDTDIFGNYAYTLITIDANHDFGNRRAYRLHNDHIRDARFTVTAVSHDKHRQDDHNKSVKKPVSHGIAAAPGRIGNIHERDRRDNRQPGQDNEHIKRVQPGNHETAANPGRISQKNNAFQHNRPDRKDQKVSKKADPPANKPATSTKTRQKETTDRRAVASTPPTSTADVRAPRVRNGTPHQNDLTAAQTGKQKPNGAKQSNHDHSYGKNVSKVNDQESTRDKNSDKVKGSAKDKNRSKDSDQNKDEDKGPSIDRTQGDKRFIQDHGRRQSRMADAAATNGR